MKVFLDWQVDTDKRLQEIGRASLDSFSATEANVFSSTVPTKIRYLIQEIFATVGLAVEFVDMPGNDVHQIIMSAETKRPRPGFLIFGETEPILDNSTMFPTVDYGDMAKSDVCTVYLGSIRDSLRKAPRAGNGLRIPEWSPMRTDDSFETRLDDVAFFLASTCTHELGHSLGLVAFQDTLPGGWMLGSPGGHNPFGVDFIKKLRDIDDKIPETILQRRFQGGGFVMDDELQAERSLRFGRTRPYGERSIVKFNSANSAYLQLLY